MAEVCTGEDNDETSESEDSVIATRRLCPKELLQIKVRVDEQEVMALVDTGASKTLIKSKFAHEIYSSDKKNISGLGNKLVKLMGESAVSLLICGTDFNWKSLVVEDNDIGYDMILGQDFIRHHKMRIDLKRRKLTFQRSDKATIRMKVDEEGELSNIMVENIPVYCKMDFNHIKTNCMTKVAVNFQNLNIKTEENQRLLFYEGNNGRVESLDGVMEDNGDNYIWVNKVSKRRNIKRGEIVGYVNTMMVTDENKTVGSEEDEWNEVRINNEVQLADNLSMEEKDQVRRLLLDWNTALSKGDADIGKADVEPHEIDVTQRTPIWQKPRNFSQPINDEVERQCSELLAHDILDYSNSNWSSPIVPVRKSDGSLRLCVDYRQVNKVTKKEEYPMPNLNKCVYRPSKVKYFTKLDLVRGYYQVPIDKNSRKYTAFSTMQHHYEFKRLSFGLKNSGMAFQRIMQHILSPLLHNNIIIYIDDILIMSETFQEHVELVGKVLRLLATYMIKIKVSKCEWFKEEVAFLGHIISSKGIKKSPEFIEKVMKVEKPETVKQLRKFIGLVNFQRKFINNCSLLTKPLTEWMNGKGSKKIIWSEEMDQVFVRLKEAVSEDIMLTYPDYGKAANKLELYVDASGTGCGACLMQKQEGVPKVIAYGSMTFSNTERRYSTTDREMTAIRWGVNNFRCFLGGVPFILVTDHKPLTYLNTMSSTNSRLMRTVEEMAEFEFEIRYRPGKENEAADFLSRSNKLDGEENEEVTDHKYLPPGLKTICEVSGGGDSMFQSLHIAMKEAKEFYGYEGDIPDDHKTLRETIVEEVSRNCKEYGLNDGKQLRHRLRIMKKEGQQPIVEVLLAASKLYGVKVHVYYGMKSPVVFVYDDKDDRFIVRLQCISNIHYNPLCERGRLDEKVKEENVNRVLLNKVESCGIGEDVGEVEDLEIDLQESDNFHCDHAMYHTSVSVKGLTTDKFCCLLDTGAQVSIVSETVIDKIRENGLQIEIYDNSCKLIGVAKDKQGIVGYVNLEVVIKDVGCIMWPFAVVKNQDMPICFLMGANFIEANDIELDLGNDRMMFKGRKVIEQFVINSAFLGDVNHKFGVEMCCRLSVNETRSEDEYNSQEEADYDSDEVNVVPKYMVSDGELVNMQKRNHAISKLRHKINNKVPSGKWNLKALDQFKRSSRQLRFKGGLLVKENDDGMPVVVSMPYMVEIVSKTHTSLNHVGRHKLVGAIRPYFWHPGLDGLCRDYCKSCPHCQRMKNHRIIRTPPIKKISTSRPFELLCVDLLKYPRSKKGNEFMLVCIDHFSKWLTVQPIRDKRSQTVARALRDKVLPTLPRIPERLLSDNGGEFVGSEFRQVLEEMNIIHCTSSPYFAPGNGCAERVNRTIIQLLKGDEGNCWDEKIYKMVINYNNSVHSETKKTPSQCILMERHDVSQRFPVSAEVIKNWREGNPRFCPFKVGQKVLKKVIRIGNLLIHKLQDKYEGPFVVKSVQSNEMSYEIYKEGEYNRRWKVNHRHLRAWHDVPNYISRYLKDDDSGSRDIGSRQDSFRASTTEVSTSSEQFDSDSSTSKSSDKYDETGSNGSPEASVDEVENLQIVIDDSNESTDVNQKGGTGGDTKKKVVQYPRLERPINETSVEVKGTVSTKNAEQHSTPNILNQHESENVNWEEMLRQRIRRDKIVSEIVRDSEETKKRVRVLEQRLMVCDELAERVVEHISINGVTDMWQNEAALISSVTSYDPNEGKLVLHSTPKHSNFEGNTDPSVSIFERIKNGTDETSNVLFEERRTVSFNEPASNLNMMSASEGYEFSGFIRDEQSGALKTAQHIFNVIDRIQHRIQSVCRGDSNTSQSPPKMVDGQQISALIGESEDVVGELPQIPMKWGLRRSTRLRRPPDRYVSDGK